MYGKCNTWTLKTIHTCVHTYIVCLFVCFLLFIKPDIYTTLTVTDIEQFRLEVMYFSISFPWILIIVIPGVSFLRLSFLFFFRLLALFSLEFESCEIFIINIVRIWAFLMCCLQFYCVWNWKCFCWHSKWQWSYSTTNNCTDMHLHDLLALHFDLFERRSVACIFCMFSNLYMPNKCCVHNWLFGVIVWKTLFNHYLFYAN